MEEISRFNIWIFQEEKKSVLSKKEKRKREIEPEEGETERRFNATHPRNKPLVEKKAKCYERPRHVVHFIRYN